MRINSGYSAWLFAAGLLSTLAAGSALSEERGGNSAGEPACGRTIWTGNCGSATGGQIGAGSGETTGAIALPGISSSTGRTDANGVGPSDEPTGKSKKEHVDAGPGNGGEGAAGEDHDQDPGHSGGHNNAPDSPPGRSK